MEPTGIAMTMHSSRWRYYLDTSAFGGLVDDEDAVLCPHSRSQTMRREEVPLTPDWLRRLRDAHAEAGAQQDAERTSRARELAARLGLQIGVRPERSARPQQ